MAQVAQTLANAIAAYACEDLGLRTVTVTLSTEHSLYKGEFHALQGLPVVNVWLRTSESLLDFAETILHEIRHYWQWIRQTYQGFKNDTLSERDADCYAHDILRQCEFVHILSVATHPAAACGRK